MRRKECAKLDPESYLHPHRFKTAFDTPGDDTKMYNLGLEYGRKALRIIITSSGSWNTVVRCDDIEHHSEIIGYDVSTWALLRGLLDSGTEIIVYRDNGMHRIKENAETRVKITLNDDIGGEPSFDSVMGILRFAQAKEVISEPGLLIAEIDKNSYKRLKEMWPDSVS